MVSKSNTDVEGSQSRSISALINDKDKFGYYSVGDIKTYSKVEAIELGKKTKRWPRWDFNDSIFGLYDWTTPCALSLKELYRQRAQQIREKYDYVVIWYSGGADSFNVLDSFLSNGIKVDEIAHCWSVKADKTYDTYFNAEIKRVAIPNTQRIKQQFPGIRHRVIDQSDHIASLLEGSMMFDWIYQSNNNLSPNALSRSYLRETEPDYLDIINQEKKLVFVWGSDKPRIYWDPDQQKFFCQFLDLIDNILSPRTQMLSRPWEHDEFFYWSPDCVDLIIKQCHEVIKILQQNKDNPVWFSNHNPNRWGFNPHLNKHLTQHGMHQIIYPNWDINTFQWQKTRSSVFGDRDLWYFKSRDLSRGFRMGVDKIKQIALEENCFNLEFLNTHRMYDGIKNFLSPRYYLQ